MPRGSGAAVRGVRREAWWSSNVLHRDVRPTLQVVTRHRARARRRPASPAPETPPEALRYPLPNGSEGTAGVKAQEESAEPDQIARPSRRGILGQSAALVLVFVAYVLS